MQYYVNFLLLAVLCKFLLLAVLCKFSDSAMFFGLTINLNKTEILDQTVPNTNPIEPKITVDDTQLTNANSFKYLGSIFLSGGSLDKETDFRISKASSCILEWSITQCLYIHKVYRVVIIPSLLYGNELCINVVSNNWRSFTWVLSASSLTFDGKTLFPTWSSWVTQSPPALSPLLSEPRCSGWDMSSKWMAIVYLTNCSMMYWRLERP